MAPSQPCAASHHTISRSATGRRAADGTASIPERRSARLVTKPRLSASCSEAPAAGRAHRAQTRLRARDEAVCTHSSGAKGSDVEHDVEHEAGLQDGMLAMAVSDVLLAIGQSSFSGAAGAIHGGRTAHVGEQANFVTLDEGEIELLRASFQR